MLKVIDKTIVALDGMNKEECLAFIKKNHQHLKTYKIGMEAFYRYGPSIVTEVYHQFQCKIFLDLKLHDIPKTVHNGIKSLKGLPLAFLTVHLSGGREMIKQAVEAQKKYLPQTKLLGVTYLTSLGHQDFSLLGLQNTASVNDSFIQMVELAKELNMGGLICSPLDLPLISPVKSSLLAVCPGVRFDDELAKGAIQDQKRVTSPLQAFQSGADYIVMGRPLTKTDQLKKRIYELNQTLD